MYFKDKTVKSQIWPNQTNLTALSQEKAERSGVSSYSRVTLVCWEMVITGQHEPGKLCHTHNRTICSLTILTFFSFCMKVVFLYSASELSYFLAQVGQVTAPVMSITFPVSLFFFYQEKHLQNFITVASQIICEISNINYGFKD